MTTPPINCGQLAVVTVLDHRHLCSLDDFNGNELQQMICVSDAAKCSTEGHFKHIYNGFQRDVSITRYPAK